MHKPQFTRMFSEQCFLKKRHQNLIISLVRPSAILPMGSFRDDQCVPIRCAAVLITPQKLDAKPHLRGIIAFVKSTEEERIAAIFCRHAMQGSNKRSRLFDSNQTSDALTSLAMGELMSITSTQFDPKKRVNRSKLALQQLSADAGGETGRSFHGHQTD